MCSAVLELCSADAQLVSEEQGIYCVGGTTTGYFGSFVATAYVDTGQLDTVTASTTEIMNSQDGDMQIICTIPSTSCLARAKPLGFNQHIYSFFEFYFITERELKWALDRFVNSVLDHAVRLHDSKSSHFVHMVKCVDTHVTIDEIKSDRQQLGVKMKNSLRDRVGCPVAAAWYHS